MQKASKYHVIFKTNAWLIAFTREKDVMNDFSLIKQEYSLFFYLYIFQA